MIIEKDQTDLAYWKDHCTANNMEKSEIYICTMRLYIYVRGSYKTFYGVLRENVYSDILEKIYKLIKVYD